MDFVQNKGGLVQNSVNGSDLVILKGNFGNIKNKQAMKTNKKDLRDVETQVFPSDHEQVDPKVNVTNSNQRPYVRDAAMAAAGVAAGVAGSAIFHSQAAGAATSSAQVNAANVPIVGSADQSPANTTEAASPAAITAEDAESKTDNTATPEPAALHVAVGANVAQVDESQSFSEAFADARSQVGPGGVFSYHGNLYNTYYKNEWDNMTPDQKGEYYASVSQNNTPANDVAEVHTLNAPIQETSDQSAGQFGQSNENEVYVLGMGSATIEGQEVYVAHLASSGNDVILLDIDKDGTYDLAFADVNGDGQISQDEVVDISDKHLTVNDMQGALNHQAEIFAQDPTLPDYTNNADISYFG
jgi:hypothetical protein